jgi:CheY-like chemotaxis protein
VGTRLAIDGVRIVERVEIHNLLSGMPRALDVGHTIEKTMRKPTAPRLLLADDNTVVLNASAAALILHGFEVHTAIDGLSALTAIQHWHPDIALLDIEMPLMDGRTVARNVRAMVLETQPLLIALTALTSLADRLASIQAGFNYHFTKPVQFEALLRTLDFHLDPSLKHFRPTDGTT